MRWRYRWSQSRQAPCGSVWFEFKSKLRC